MKSKKKPQKNHERPKNEALTKEVFLEILRKVTQPVLKPPDEGKSRTSE